MKEQGDIVSVWISSGDVFSRHTFKLEDEGFCACSRHHLPIDPVRVNLFLRLLRLR